MSRASVATGKVCRGSHSGVFFLLTAVIPAMIGRFFFLRNHRVSDQCLWRSTSPPPRFRGKWKDFACKV